jgi:hypothetical protein
MAYRQKYDDRDIPEETWARALKAGYGEVAHEPMPGRFRELLERLDDAERDDRCESREPCHPTWLTRPPRDR